jgi:hypothetical protein
MKYFTLLSLSVAILAGCGGGGGDSPVVVNPPAPISSDPVLIVSPPHKVTDKGVQNYTTFNGYSAAFYVWEGEKTILRSVRNFTPAEAETIVTNNDNCFALYQRFGQTTWPSNGTKGQLAVVPDNTTCGAGCGAAGQAEMSIAVFDQWRGSKPNTDPYAWWVGYYEFGREGGRAFPIYQKLDHFHGDSTEPGERLTSAFPEYIWQRCLRNDGYNQDQILARGPYASQKYQQGFLASKLTYVQAIKPDAVDIAIPNSSDVWPSNLITAVLYYMNDKYGDSFMDSFFSHVMTKGDALTAHQSACNILRSAKEADTSKSAELQDYLVTQWKFPTDCVQ